MVLEKTLESPLTSKGIKPVYLKGNQPCIFMEELMLKLKLQYFGHLMGRADSLERTLRPGKIEGRRKRGLQRISCLDGIINSIDLSLSNLWEIVNDWEAWHSAAHRVTKSWTTPVRKHLRGSFLCAVLDLSGILCSLLIPEYSGIKRRCKPLPGADESRHFLY